MLHVPIFTKTFSAVHEEADVSTSQDVNIAPWNASIAHFSNAFDHKTDMA